jgi:hypothetical protein
MIIGSEAHKRLFCESFIASHRVYKPEHLPFPDLDQTALEILQAVPFWDEALFTERSAGVLLKAYAQHIDDPMLHEAIALQATEEARHSQLIEHLLKLYKIPTPSRPVGHLPNDLESAFIEFGYGECFDSFFAFGLFEIARKAGLVPEHLFTIFDPILDEEARHIVFFVNWFAYKQIQSGRGGLRRVSSLWHYRGALQRRLANLSAGKEANTTKDKKGFTATGAKAFTTEFTLDKFLEACLKENARRMSVYDERLLRPKFLSISTAMVTKSLKIISPRRSRPTNNPI